MSRYQVSTIKVTEVTLFSMIEGKLGEDQINTIQNVKNTWYLKIFVLKNEQKL